MRPLVTWPSVRACVSLPNESPVRLPVAGDPAEAGGIEDEPEEGLPPLPGGAARDASARRKRALGTRAPAAVPQGANQRWSLDFVSDALNDGRRFRVLNIVDDFTRECLAAVVDTSPSRARVVRELNAFASLAEARRIIEAWADRLQHRQIPYQPRRPIAVDGRKPVP